MFRQGIMSVIMVACAYATWGDVYYVNVNNTGSTKDGLTPETGFNAIQQAIDKAAEGDTIKVLPGVYNKGNTANAESSDDAPSRVYINKPLLIESTGGADVTHIVGYLDPNGVKGAGASAVRCVRFAKDAATGGKTPSILRGFTIRDGGCLAQAASEHGGDSYAGQPGGIAFTSEVYTNAFVTDCVISNCVAVRGGLVRYGNFVRCKFSNGHSISGSLLGRAIKLAHCLVTGFKDSDILTLDNSQFVNCTFADIYNVPFYNKAGSSLKFYNCVFGQAKTYTEKATLHDAYCSIVDTYQVSNKTACVVNEPRPFFAPLCGDFRLRPNANGVGIGEATYLTTVFGANVPEEVDLFRSLDDVKLAGSGKINPGCYQELSESPAAGAVLVTKPVICNGYEGSGDGLYAYATEEYTTFKLEPPNGKLFFDMFVGGRCVYPFMDETVRVITPPVGLVATSEVTYASKELYIDPAGSDTTGDGTLTKPWQTLQYANDHGVNFAIIHAAEGDYRKGGAVNWEVTNRLYIGKLNLRFKGAGRGLSTIWGEADPNATAAANGMGPAAMRCVGLIKDLRCCVQGFTLRNGHSDYSSTSAWDNRYCGGLVMANDNGGAIGKCQVVDCELTDGTAYRGAVALNTTLIRSIIHGVTGLSGGATRTTAFENCVSYGNTFASGSCTLNTSEGYFYHCTSVDSKCPIVSCSTFFGTNCVIYSHETHLETLTAKASHNVFSGYSLTDSELGGNIAVDNPWFVDEENGDLRLRSTSDVLKQSIAPAENYWRYAQGDVYGNPMQYIDGKIIPGAIQTPATTIIVAKPNTGSIKPEGTNILEVGQTLTVEYDGTGATRPSYGIAVNGESVTTGTTWSYTDVGAFDESGKLLPGMWVSAILSTNWYVNASMTDDDGDGFTPETAKRTLAGALGLPLVSGDVVHVAPGTYAEKTAASTLGTADVACRVSVPSGVTFVGDEGAEKTVIMGSGNVRPASLAKRAVLKGFTLTGGVLGTSGDITSVRGGGFIAEATSSTIPKADWAYVKDCIISNNVCSRGGGGTGGVAMNCKIIGNTAATTSGALYYVRAYGCFIDKNVCGSTQLFRFIYGVQNCVITAGNYNSDGKNECSQMFANRLENGTICNSICLGKGGSDAQVVSNCVFVTGKYTTTNLDDPDDTCIWIKDVAELSLDKNYRPAKESILVDAGANAAVDEVFDVDFDGIQRIYNGNVDIGMYEYDWRPIYKKDLGRDTFSFLHIDPQVVETEDKKVLIREGEIKLKVPAVSGPDTRVVTIRAEVTGEGTFTVLINGVEYTSFTRSAGEQTLKIENFLPDMTTISLVYAKAEGDNDFYGAVLSEFGCSVPGFMIMYK